MPAMKLTPNAAMRARDVSRPRAEHLADAEAAEAGMAGGARVRAGDAGKRIAGIESPGTGSAGTGSAARPEPDEIQAGGAAGDGRGRAVGDGRGERAGFPRPRRRRGRPAR